MEANMWVVASTVVTALATLVIAIAMVLYVHYSKKFWRETRNASLLHAIGILGGFGYQTRKEMMKKLFPEDMPELWELVNKMGNR